MDIAFALLVGGVLVLALVALARLSYVLYYSDDKRVEAPEQPPQPAASPPDDYTRGEWWKNGQEPPAWEE